MIEFLKQEGVYEMVWFLSGVLCYMTLQFIVGAKSAYKLIKATMYASLSLLLRAYSYSLEEIEFQRKEFKKRNPDYTDYALEKEFSEREEQINKRRDKAFAAMADVAPPIFEVVRKEINDAVNTGVFDD